MEPRKLENPEKAIIDMLSLAKRNRFKVVRLGIPEMIRPLLGYMVGGNYQGVDVVNSEELTITFEIPHFFKK